jgi:hypothetical protein
MMRGLAVAVSGTLALAVALALDPRCLHGPFVRVDPAIWPMWLDDVREMRPLLPLFRVNPLTVAAIAAFPAAALLATGALLAQADLRREFGLWAAAAAFITAAFTTVAAIRGFSYAIWLGMPLVAALAPRLFALLRLRVLSARVVASLMLTPMALSSGAITIADANGLRDTDSFARPESRHCIASASYAPPDAPAARPGGDGRQPWAVSARPDAAFGHVRSLPPAGPWHRHRAQGVGLATGHGPPPPGRSQSGLRDDLRPSATGRVARARSQPEPLGCLADWGGTRMARTGAGDAAVRGLSGSVLIAEASSPIGGRQVLAAKGPPPI